MYVHTQILYCNEKLVISFMIPKRRTIRLGDGNSGGFMYEIQPLIISYVTRLFNSWV